MRPKTDSKLFAHARWDAIPHREIAEQQRAAGVRVIKPPRALGFLDPDLPPLSQAAPASVSCELTTAS